MLAAFAARLTRKMDTALQGFSATFAGLDGPLHISGPAMPAGKMRKPDGGALMIRREILAAKARHARNMRRSREASLIEADLRRVTLEILRGCDGV